MNLPNQWYLIEQFTVQSWVGSSLQNICSSCRSQMLSCFRSRPITEYAFSPNSTRMTQRVPLLEQNISTLFEHQNPPFFQWRPCCSFCPITFLQLFSPVLQCYLRFMHKNSVFAPIWYNVCRVSCFIYGTCICIGRCIVESNMISISDYIRVVWK